MQLILIYHVAASVRANIWWFDDSYSPRSWCRHTSHTLLTPNLNTHTLTYFEYFKPAVFICGITSIAHTWADEGSTVSLLPPLPLFNYLWEPHILELKTTNSPHATSFPGTLTSDSYRRQIPDLHFWGIFSDFPEPSQRAAGCLAGGAGTSPECAPTWIIQQPVWKMIVFGSIIDLPPVERWIYSLGAAAVEGVFVLFKN